MSGKINALIAPCKQRGGSPYHHFKPNPFGGFLFGKMAVSASEMATVIKVVNADYSPSQHDWAD